MLSDKRILLIITGGIAAYKSLDLIRRLQERGAKVRAVLTNGGSQFITPLAVGALTGDTVFTELFDREAEHDVGHIRLSREADLVVVAPATANIMAKMAHGLADDLASCVLLANDKPVLVAPAMNSKMWSHPATQRNVAQLKADGLHFVGPNAGEMAEKGEAGYGRMSEPLEIVVAIEDLLSPKDLPLKGKRIVITAGPTHEPIDPVRYIANRSSGKQGYAIAEAAAEAGAQVTLVSGPTILADPKGVETIRVESANAMLAAVECALPADIAIMAAAVADWRVAHDSNQKIKKDGSGLPPALNLVENPDILKTVGHLQDKRPKLVVGFAAETNDLIANARGKLERKGADMIVANDVSPENNVMGGDNNTVRLVTHGGVEDWPKMGKDEVARQLVQKIAELS
ncbi:phosphopantothenoylcysteine decarboxylase / phosphopantothenate--cysteine ligase [Pseudovibrio denitrificans]|uniref:Coenzyme A biosynthesis bifunctional protein CoaBC n=1 Tax=Pseudovibrio denitrificans TaxID=258256 RepID=A0A1I7AUP7_9HYPH|nr:bifunctional phosphopantothenoylcysteine decarboxylase/phosphopantothenate--cysteine ligase CoaBC [Pseudovibrio denitrificans]SFT78628.1 phosphopantothenoylcysteine decarboxylase / phosphopantothenate--cysteine ligase [Pseudovibrio denitrificans]